MKILIVGNGRMGSRHLRLSRRFLPDAEIKILIHQRLNGNVKLSDSFLESMEQVRKFGPHIAIIANPAPFHLEIAQELARAGIHLLVEKPLATSTLGIKELIKTCKKNNIILMTGYNLRFSPSLKYFHELIKGKTVGKILSVRCEVGQYLPDWRPTKDYRMTVSANHSLGGGVLLELSHEIDYLRWIFGEIKLVSAILSRQSSLEIDVEDSAHLFLRFEPNTEGHEIIATLNLDFIRHDNTRSCTVIGENGTLRWNALTGVIDIYQKNSVTWEVLFTQNSDTDETLIAEWENFLDSISKNVEPCVTGEDGFRVLEIIEAARKSSDIGSQVLVNKSPLFIETVP
jgi:predicted dehydrogenase